MCLLIFSALWVYLLIESYRQEHDIQNTKRQNLSKIVAVGITTNNRATIEAALENGRNSFKANKIALCRDDKAIVTMPYMNDQVACLGKRRWNAQDIVTQVSDLKEYYIYVHEAPNVVLFLILKIGTVTLAAMTFFVALMKYLTKIVNRDLIAPLLKGSDFIGQNSIHMLTEGGIKELDDIFLQYQLRVDEIKGLHKKVEASRQYEAIAKTTQIVAHDVRKPFSLIKMGLKMLKACETKEEVKEAVAILDIEVGRAVESVEGMINEILEFGRPTTVNKVPQNLAEFIDRIVGQTVAIYPEVKQRIDSVIQPDLVVQIDPLRFERVVTNLINNALEAMGAAGRVWVNATSKDNRGSVIQIVVGNTGSFVEAEKITLLFEPFFTQGKREGTGLGLAIVKKIVQDHGGTISCLSDSKNTVEFVIDIPRL